MEPNQKIIKLNKQQTTTLNAAMKLSAKHYVIAKLFKYLMIGSMTLIFLINEKYYTLFFALELSAGLIFAWHTRKESKINKIINSTLTEIHAMAANYERSSNNP